MRAMGWLMSIYWRIRHPRDRCTACHGKKGGVWGNENVVDGKLLCDYCHGSILQQAKSGSSKPVI